VSEYEVAHGELRANVPRRRTAYKSFIIAVVAVFLLSMADIIWFDEVLFWPVVIAYVILFVWAIALLFSRRVGDAETLWNVGERILHCPQCESDFLYAADHVNDSGTGMSCPVCGKTSDLPGPDAQTIGVELPATEPVRTAYHCDHCEEHFVVSTLGRPARSVAFESCPHCHTKGSVTRTQAPQHLERHDATPA